MPLWEATLQSWMKKKLWKVRKRPMSALPQVQEEAR